MGLRVLARLQDSYDIGLRGPNYPRKLVGHGDRFLPSAGETGAYWGKIRHVGHHLKTSQKSG
jgi:hypothetical protein